ncbi:MAG: D-glycero-beta-D-manno-heptose-7-phosphate kinase [Pseudomonadota bacterium]
MDKKLLKEVVKSFGTIKTIVIGDIMMDQFIWGKVSRISPEAPIPVVDVQKESMMLGGAGNVASNLISLGARVLLCGVVGHDAMGRDIVHELKRRGCTAEGIIFEKNRPTTVKTRVVAHGQQVVRFDREQRAEIKEETADQILSFVQKNLSDTDAVIVSDYSKGVVCAGLMDKLRPVFNRRKVIWAVDPKTRDVKMFRGATIFTPNQNEAEIISGIRIGSEESLRMAGDRILRLLNAKAVLVTRGDAGMALFEKDGELFTIPTVAKEVYDVTGAGDTVIAAMALGLAAGLKTSQAAILANFAAGIVVGKIGTATVRPEELEAAVAAG